MVEAAVQSNNERFAWPRHGSPATEPENPSTTFTRMQQQWTGPPEHWDDQGMLSRHVRSRSRPGAGFTLIELLVTIAIIGILAGIAVIGVQQFRARAVVSACKADVESVSVAAATYRMKTGAYPAPLTGSTSADSTARLATLSSSGYLRQLPPTADYVVTLGSNGAATGAKLDGASCS